MHLPLLQIWFEILNVLIFIYLTANIYKYFDILNEQNICNAAVFKGLQMSIDVPTEPYESKILVSFFSVF